MVNDDSPALHPDLTRARFTPRTSATRGNHRLLRALTRIGCPPSEWDAKLHEVRSCTAAGLRFLREHPPRQHGYYGASCV